MTENIIIEKALESDVPDIRRISKEQWAKIFDAFEEQIGHELYDACFHGALEKKEKAIGDYVLKTGNCFVARIDGKIVGFATYDIETVNDHPVGILEHNAVDDAYKGRGIAKKLYDEVFELMKSIGCRAVRVLTGLDEIHSPARRAYEKAGFEASLPSIQYFKKL